MAKVRLEPIYASGLMLLYTLQVSAFDDLFTYYQDIATSPATESYAKVKERFFKSNTSHFWILNEENNTIVGAVRVEDNDDAMRLGNIFVLPQYQKNGYGTEAVQLLEAMYPGRKWITETIYQEIKLLNFYRRLGYKETDLLININEKTTLIIMEK